MKKLYFIITFICLFSFAQAQELRTSDNSLSAMAQLKVIKFYPNPATTVINFELLKANQKNITLQVYNFVGKKLFEKNNITQKTTLPLTEFYRGVYIYQLRDIYGRIVESGKFQVVK